jgi:hypothetical protein
MLGQDSTAVAKPSARDFGLCMGFSSTRVDLTYTPYYNAATQQLITVEGDQRLGLSIGMFYNFALTSKMMLRSTVEAHITNTSITYVTGEEYNEHYSVMPVTVELPVSFIYGANQRGTIESRGWRGMGLLLGARPVLPITLFNSTFPATKNFTFNIDLGISLPKALRKTVMRTEIFLSANVLNGIASSSSADFRTNMISDMRRHFVGLRLYFN